MRKNRMMRLASALLILTMVTTCAISGTFAKYTSAAEADDTARVAKWGMTVEAGGTLFGANYEAKTTSGGNIVSASAAGSVDCGETTAVNIVAPGTKSDKGLTLAVKGQPEVAYKVTYEQPVDPEDSTKTLTNQDIWLGAGKYGVLVETDQVTADNVDKYYHLDGSTYVKGAASSSYSGKWYELRDTADVTSDYFPIDWTVTKIGVDGSVASTDPFTTKHIEVVAGNMSGEFNSIPGTVNVQMNKEYTITWEWPFEQGENDAEKAKNNAADTILGNLIAAKGTTVNYVVIKATGTETGHEYDTCVMPTETTSGTNFDYSLNVKFGAKITVTQID